MKRTLAVLTVLAAAPPLPCFSPLRPRPAVDHGRPGTYLLDG